MPVFAIRYCIYLCQYFRKITLFTTFKFIVKSVGIPVSAPSRAGIYFPTVCAFPQFMAQKTKTSKQKPKNKKPCVQKNAPDSNLNKGLLHGWNVVISAAPHVIKWQQCPLTWELKPEF